MVLKNYFDSDADAKYQQCKCRRHKCTTSCNVADQDYQDDFYCNFNSSKIKNTGEMLLNPKLQK
jgi:hypothetical protein